MATYSWFSVEKILYSLCFTILTSWFINQYLLYSTRSAILIGQLDLNDSTALNFLRVAAVFILDTILECFLHIKSKAKDKNLKLIGISQLYCLELLLTLVILLMLTCYWIRIRVTGTFCAWGPIILVIGLYNFAFCACAIHFL